MKNSRIVEALHKCHWLEVGRHSLICAFSCPMLAASRGSTHQSGTRLIVVKLMVRDKSRRSPVIASSLATLHPDQHFKCNVPAHVTSNQSCQVSLKSTTSCHIPLPLVYNFSIFPSYYIPNLEITIICVEMT